MNHDRVQIVSLSHHQTLLEELHQLRNTGHLCDITVQVDHQGNMSEFEAHQVMLAASSGYFKSILLAEEPVKKALLCDVPASAFEAFLQYVYTGQVEVEKTVLHNIFKMAELLECVDLLDACKALSGLAVATDNDRPHPQDLVEPDVSFDTPSTPSTPTPHSPSKRRGRKPRPKTKAGEDPSESKDSDKKPQKKRKKKEAEEVDEDAEESDGGEEGKDATEATEAQGKRQSSRLASRTKPLGRHRTKHPRRGRPKASVEPSDAVLEGKEASEVIAALESVEPTAGDAFTSQDPLGNSDNESFISSPMSSPSSSDFAESGAEDEDATTTAEGKRRGRTSRVTFSCEKCDKSFLYEKSYLKHMQQNHGEQPQVEYRCPTCLQTFANRCNLKFHQLHVHSDKRLFPCDICGKAFKRKKDVKRHQKQVHEGGTERHYCPECGKGLSSRTALKLHERTHTGYKPYECLECNAKFSQSSALKTHHRTHTGEKPFACDQCDAKFTQNHMLVYHKRCHTGERPFMCEICGKNFASKEYLKHHARLHSGYKPYKCEVCARPFAQRNSLHQHMKTHTGERPYHCTDCEKKFTQLNALQRHQRIHRGEKPFMCTLCSRTFTDKSTLRRHAMTHDKDTPWRNFLKVLKDNVEEKAVRPPRAPAAKKEKSAPKGAKAEPRSSEASKTQTQTQVQTVMTETVTLPADWASHGTITLVSPAALGGFAVIQTEVGTSTQLQPVLTPDGTVAVPISIPISVSHATSVAGGDSSGSSSGTTTTIAATGASSSTTLPIAVTEAILAGVQKQSHGLQGQKQVRRKASFLSPGTTVEVTTTSPTLEAAMVAGEIQCVTVGDAEKGAENTDTDAASVAQVAETCVITE